MSSNDHKTATDREAELLAVIERELAAYFCVGGVYRSVGEVRWVLHKSAVTTGSFRFVRGDDPDPSVCRAQETFMVLEGWQLRRKASREPSESPVGVVHVIAGDGTAGYLLVGGGGTTNARGNLMPWSDISWLERII